MTPLTLIIIFVSATFFVLSVFFLLRWLLAGSQYQVSQRLRELTKDQEVKATDIPDIVRGDQLSQIPILNRLLQKLDVSERLQRVIGQANLTLSVGQLLLLMMIFGGLSLLLTARLGNLFLTVVCFFILGSLPLVYVFHHRGKRFKLFTEQFPDALDMMTNALRAGHAFVRALQLVATEAPDPVGMEFRKTFEEQNLGIPVKEALLNLTQRIDIVDLKLFATAVIIQRESGGNLTEMLTKISATIRARFKLLGQIKVLTAQGRFSGLILGSLPIGIALIVSTLNPDYISLLWTEPTGRIMIAIGLTMQILGFIIMQKIVKIKLE